MLRTREGERGSTQGRQEQNGRWSARQLEMNGTPSYEWITSVEGARDAQGDTPAQSPVYAAKYAVKDGKPEFPPVKSGATTLHDNFRFMVKQQPDALCLGAIRQDVCSSSYTMIDLLNVYTLLFALAFGSSKQTSLLHKRSARSKS